MPLMVYNGITANEKRSKMNAFEYLADIEQAANHYETAWVLADARETNEVANSLIKKHHAIAEKIMEKISKEYDKKLPQVRKDVMQYMDNSSEFIRSASR